MILLILVRLWPCAQQFIVKNHLTSHQWKASLNAWRCCLFERNSFLQFLLQSSYDTQRANINHDTSYFCTKAIWQEFTICLIKNVSDFRSLLFQYRYIKKAQTNNTQIPLPPNPPQKISRNLGNLKKYPTLNSKFHTWNLQDLILLAGSNGLGCYKA